MQTSSVSDVEVPLVQNHIPLDSDEPKSCIAQRLLKLEKDPTSRFIREYREGNRWCVEISHKTQLYEKVPTIWHYNLDYAAEQEKNGLVERRQVQLKRFPRLKILRFPRLRKRK